MFTQQNLPFLSQTHHEHTVHQMKDCFKINEDELKSLVSPKQNYNNNFYNFEISDLFYFKAVCHLIYGVLVMGLRIKNKFCRFVNILETYYVSVLFYLK